MVDSGFTFDNRSATVAVNFFEKLLQHTKGEWAGTAFKLAEWQRDCIIRPLFGWKRPDGTRRYRRAYIEIPRKNGKSTLAAGIGLFLLTADAEQGAEIYSAAADRDQASIVFDEARRMVEASPELARRAQVYKRSIVIPSTNSVYRVLSADAFSKHGLNASGIIFDELHAQPNRELWDVLATSTGARRQPLTVAITTAGYDRESICYEQHDYARKILDGVLVDNDYFAYISGADDSDDWTSPDTWRKANPGLNITVKEDYLAAEARRAAAVPAYQNTFRRLHLNQWTQQDVRWLDLSAWDRCGEFSFTARQLEGAVCYGGLDLASTSDLAAFSLVFPPDDEGKPFCVLTWYWIPEDNMIDRARRDRVSYDSWARDGFITATPGAVIDYSWITEDINRLSAKYQIREIAFDRWGAFQISQALEGAGLAMIGFGQGFASMSGPTKELLRLVLDNKLAHGANPVTRWMADNVVVSQDPAGNVKPNKQRSRDKIDGIVSIIMGLDRAIRHEDGGQSVYKSRGLISL